MARQYSVIFENVSIALAQDLFNIQPAADKPVRILALMLSNVGGTADAGDAQEELLRLLFKRYNTATVTNGTGGSTPAGVPVDVSDAAAGFTARANDATTRSSTSGTTVNLHADGWNIRVPYQLILPPEMQWEAAGTAQRIIIGLEAAPADAVSCSGTLYVEED